MKTVIHHSRTVGFTLALALGCAVALVGCEKEQGPFEKAGEKVDEAVNDTKRKVQDATD